ncbi:MULTISPECIES: DcrB-related protein [Yersinia pseudotuberculosis complex]|uniref:DcrB-related protein n=1 Tax=Yersinia pseudotuberculosis complex TaxID=1649845 RepID=UPI0005AD3220|nr:MULTISPECIES: DcrB-related protein [Yersinia pseudotuberculosis complex]AJJ72182.1 hypothetical protein BZ23_3223 [Yersinia pseudotuberculosis]PSH11344.1 hypothetical protein B7R75_20690 [Yersinia pseudotuberculosis]PSH39447.1 hypothetical protein BLA47_12380 [Yersinia pseudotuberculosis]PSH40762.1 hypothetical protein BA192_19610 [Yersinia pseudotuberculosis]CNC63261.1 Uncharacterized conserved protein [Yersinia similis]
MKDYRIQEGVFPFPGKDWVDSSMNIIKHPKTHTSLIVTRGKIPASRTFREELDFQWQQLAPLVEQLQSDPPQRVALRQAPDAHAVETLSQFIRADNTHYQRQLAIELSDPHSMLILTYTAMQPFSTEEDQYWQQVKNTLMLTE